MIGRMARYMPRLIALLRGINVGGHRVTMDALKAHVFTLKLKHVETVLASGNVIFDGPSSNLASLEQRLEKHLAAALGFEVATFIRTAPEIVAIAKFRAFPTLAAGDSVYVQFFRAAPDAALQRAILALQSDVDAFRLHGRELFWRCRGRISEVSLAWPKLEKLMKSVAATSRNLATVEKLALRVAGDS